jgi:hypothetical protein
LTDRAWILVTGSRDFRDYRLVATILNEAWHDATQDGHTRLTLVHGAAAGADSLAERWWEQHERFGVKRDRFPADWSAACTTECSPGHRKPRPGGGPGTYCPAEGSYRKQRMIDHVRPHLPAVLCIACYARPKSNGTSDAVRRARAAGIPCRLIGKPPVIKERRSEQL